MVPWSSVRGDPQSGRDGGAARRPDEQPLAPGEQLGRLERLVVGHRELGVEIVGLVDAGHHRFGHVLQALDGVAQSRLDADDLHAPDFAFR